MLRVYNNPDQASPIEAIIITPKEVGGLLEYICPRVKLRHRPEEKKIVDFHPSHIDQEFLVLNMKPDAVPDYFSDQTAWWPRMAVGTVFPVELLHEAGLISDVFKDFILTTEKSLYSEKKKSVSQRREYKVPAEDNALVDAFIVQRHNRFQPFIRYQKENLDAIRVALKAVGLGWDSMANEFESYLILGGTICAALKKLTKAGLISESFQDAVWEKEKHIENVRHRFRTEGLHHAVYQGPRFHGFFNQLETLIADMAIHSPVRHGLFAGSRARPVRALQAELSKIKNKEVEMVSGLSEIIEIASKMGAKHPIVGLARKCAGALGQMLKDERAAFERTAFASPRR
jgi:hypothetical protein